MPYWRLFYHLVWATEERAPLIDEAVAAALERSFRATCEETSVRVFAVGLMPDHVHLVVSIPPRIALADIAGRLKGASSYAAKGPDLSTRQSHFAWQAEYGALSFGEKALPDIVDYACNQPSRHATHALWPALERFTESS